jgi:cell division protein FtsL
MTFALLMLVIVVLLFALALVISSFLRRSGIQERANAALKTAEKAVDDVHADLGK